MERRNGIGNAPHLLIPPTLQHYTFYDFIVNKARGKSGILFSFDADNGDVRLLNDAARESHESHVAKVCERSWYQKNKHIFPASRWETYDASKDYGKTAVAKTKFGEQNEGKKVQLTFL